MLEKQRTKRKRKREKERKRGREKTERERERQKTERDKRKTAVFSQKALNSKEATSNARRPFWFLDFLLFWMKTFSSLLISLVVT